ncbi:MAG TPA: hypothetical protein VJU81_02105 [Methylomirabilota bacterium]|nr:hypothetical protein [Methylomirabilota bacterium]
MPINQIKGPRGLGGLTRPKIADSMRPGIDKATPREIDEAVRGNRGDALIIAGVNYPMPRQRSVQVPAQHPTYFNRAKNYARWAFANSATTRIDRVVFFDFLSGKIMIFRRAPQSGSIWLRLDPLVLTNYRYDVHGTLTLKPGPPGVPSDQQHQRYYHGLHELARHRTGSPDADVPTKEYKALIGGSVHENSLSILDVYWAISKSVAGMIREVHFVGHAWKDGPIIVNTLLAPWKRHDKDGRASDFNPHPDLRHIFGPRYVAQFPAGFTLGATLTIWGGNRDAEDAKDDEAASLIVAAQGKAKAGKPVAAEVAQLKKLIGKTYAARLAKACRRTVYAALPGTYAVPDEDKKDDPSPYSFVPTVMHVNLTKCGHMLEFYRKHLGITFPTTGAFKGHPTFGRGYASYPPPYTAAP